MKAPGKELRFTRSRQALVFWITGLVLVLAAVGLGVLSWWQLDAPPPRWAALVPLTAGIASFWLALRLTRHAYLLFSPIGVEVFPFWKPVSDFQLIPWGTIADAGFSPDGKWLILTMAGSGDSKVFLALAPVSLRVRPLLERTVLGVMEKRQSAGEAGSVPPNDPEL